jgi:gamma-glutamylcyclotransferase (GGCT)/AIG2-like uncharacterized protein YtfP
MENKVLKLFVYGSLRSGFKHPAYEYISKYFILLGNAKVRGRLFDMGSYPAAVASNDDAFIVGELYELKNEAGFSWAFEQLDDYEGVHGEDGQPPMYVRQLSTVYYNDQTTTAWIYWFNGSIDDQPLIPSGDILEFIQHKSKL